MLWRRQGSHLETPGYILCTGCYSVTDENCHQPPRTLSQLSGHNPPPLLFSLSTSQKTEIDWEVLELQTPVISPATIHRRVACCKTLHRNWLWHFTYLNMKMCERCGLAATVPGLCDAPLELQTHWRPLRALLSMLTCSPGCKSPTGMSVSKAG